MYRNQEDWIGEYQGRGTLWIHDGNPKRPHALLTSGMHSNGFFNSKPIIADETLLHEAVCDLVDLFVSNGGDIHQPDRVVGPQTGATRLAEFISDEIGKRRGSPCFWVSPSKQGKGSDKRMVFDDPDHKVLFGEKILLCEDVLTTGASMLLVLKATLNASAVVMRFVLVLVNRSGLEDVKCIDILGLINHPMPMWNPETEKCPLCAQGSEAIRPKESLENWVRLTAKY